MEVPRNWRIQKQRYALVGEVCTHCGNKIFPPRDICPECDKPAKTPFQFSGRGEVYSYTTVYDPPAGFEENDPYTVALVKLLPHDEVIVRRLNKLGGTTPVRDAAAPAGRSPSWHTTLPPSLVQLP